MGEKDIAEKVLADYNDVFSDIGNGLLFGGKQVIKEDELTDIQTVSQYKADGSVLHEEERDVAKLWKKFGIQIAFIGMENQTDIDRFMPARVIGYDGASYRAQLLGRKKPLSLRPVITLILYFGEKRWDKPRSLYDCFEDSDEMKQLGRFVSDYRVNVFEIAYLTPEQVSMFRSDFKIVADFFVQKRMNRDYKPSREKIRHVDAVLKMLAVLSRDRRFSDIDVEAFKKLNGNEGGVNMCEILDKIENRGFANGMEQGILQGRAQGMAQGRAQGMAQGRAQGRAQAMDLVKLLVEQGRMDDLKRAYTDMSYMNELFSKF